MKPPETRDPLDTLLREHDTYIEDNGFTARVMAALPPRHRFNWLRPVLLLGTTAFGYVLAIRWLPWRLLNVSNLVSFNSQALVAYALLLAIAGSLLWGIIAALGWEE